MAWGGLVADLERAATPAGRARLGCLRIEGTRLAERALRAGRPIERAAVTAGFRHEAGERSARLVDRLLAAGTELVTVPEEVLVGLTEGRSTGGIVGLVRLPPEVPLGRLLRPGDRPAALLVACDVEDPGNVGALVRTALASACRAFVAVGVSDPFHPRAVRISMGSLFKLPLIHVAAAGELIGALRGAGVRTLGAVSTGGTPLPRLAVPRATTAVFVGREAFGLGPETAAALDERVSIPMPEGVDSFSVNAAAAVLLYQLNCLLGMPADRTR